MLVIILEYCLKSFSHHYYSCIYYNTDKNTENYKTSYVIIINNYYTSENLKSNLILLFC